MNRRWVISFFILLLVSCNGTEEKNPLPIKTESDTTSVTPAQVVVTKTADPLPTVSTPSSTLEEASPPTDTPIPATQQPVNPNPAPIITRLEGGTNSFILVGGSQNGRWVSAADIAGAAAIDSEYQLFTAFESQDWITGQELVYEPICDQNYVIVEQVSLSQSAVAISGEWSVLPRIPQELSSDIEVYLQAVAAWQVEQAPSMPIAAIKKIWQVDVEGNGTDEVFISATRFAEPTGHNVEPRDYSVILMRTVIGSDVVTIKLVGDYYSEAVENRFPLTYSLEFIGDLNGDGQMEVVVGVSRWEGSGVMVFEVDGEEAQLVLSVMCSH